MALFCEGAGILRMVERLSGWLDRNGDLPLKGRWRSVADEIDVTPEALYRELKNQRR